MIQSKIHYTVYKDVCQNQSFLVKPSMKAHFHEEWQTNHANLAPNHKLKRGTRINKTFTHCTCNSVWQSQKRELSIFHSGVVVQFSWLVGDIFWVIRSDVINRRVIDSHVRNETTKDLAELPFGINTWWQTFDL